VRRKGELFEKLVRRKAKYWCAVKANISKNSIFRTTLSDLGASGDLLCAKMRKKLSAQMRAGVKGN
jgi:hypothetical protein